MSPNGWRSRELGDLLTLEYGDGLPQRERTGQGYPVYGSSGVIGRHSDPLIEGPGIVVGRKGTVGAVVWTQEDFWPIDTTYYVRPNEDVDFRWLYWLLLHSKLGRLDASTGVPGLNRDEAYTVTVSVPPLREQQRIAAVLDAADEAIRQSDRVIAKLREVKKGLLHDLLTRGLDAEGNLRDPEVHPEQFKESPLGRIVRGWEVVTIGDVSEKVTKGTTPTTYGYDYTERGIIFLRVENLAEGGWIDTSDVLHIGEDTDVFMNRSQLEPGDVLISIAGTIGRVANVDKQVLPANVNQALALVRLKDEIFHPRFLKAYLSSRKGQESLLSQSVQLAQANLSLGQISSTLVPSPTLSEQKRIVAILDRHDTRIRAEEATLDKLRQVKRGLMDDLLAGRVRV
jgi:type I restriction enzyme S subunit